MRYTQIVNRNTANPFLKTPGGKRKLIPELSARVPANFNTYHEPFVGGGALFFWLQSQGRITKAILSDSNARLIGAYKGVRNDVETVIRKLGEMKTDRESFLAIRSAPPDGGTHAEMAAWYIYISKCGFNGLYRENRKGACNVPYGTPKNDICDPVALREASKALQCAELCAQSFEESATLVQPDDFVYFDPPYWPKSATASFTSYTAQGFKAAQQAKLRDIASKLREKGAHVLLSNSDTEQTRSLYAGFDIATVLAGRAINSRPERRGKVSELLIR